MTKTEVFVIFVVILLLAVVAWTRRPEAKPPPVNIVQTKNVTGGAPIQEHHLIMLHGLNF